MKACQQGAVREQCLGRHGGCGARPAAPCPARPRKGTLRQLARGATQRLCRCQAAPEAGGGGSLFNLRAWGAGVVSGLKLGQAEAPRDAPGESDDEDDAQLPPALLAPGEQSSWDEWQQYFRDVDDALERAEEAHVAMEEAVVGEQYAEAARLRSELGALEDRDSLGRVLREYNAALEREDYGEAARLRDAGGLGLAGWWHARSDADPCAHLLRIAPDFGRLSGLMYTSRDLAELKGWSSEASTAFPANAFLAAPDSSSGFEVTFEEAGIPCLEVFIARGPDGELRQQASVLRPTVAKLPAELPSEEALAAGLISGSMRVTVDATTEGEENVIHISLANERFLRDAPDAPGPDNPNGDATADGDAAPSGAGEDEGAMPEGYEVVHDLSELMSKIGDAKMIEVRRVDLETHMVLEEGQHAPDDGDGDEDDGSEGAGSSDYVRAPAHILCPSRSSFVLSVPPPADGDGDAPRDNAAHAAAASGPDPAPSSPTIASDLSAMVAAGPAELLAALQRRAADLAGGGKLSAPKPNAGDADAAASALPASTEAGAEAGEDKALGAAHEAKHSAWVKVAGEVRRAHEARFPHRPLPMSDAKLAEVLRGAAASAMHAVLGEQRDSRASFCLDGTVTYTRLRTDHPRTDPFAGLYLGAFGSVGAQALQLQRFTWEDGEEGVQAVKLTGDRNVPAGAVSFRARVGRGRRLRGEDAYPPELGVTARYRGQGRVAAKGFGNPKWVEGELLLLGGGAGAVRDAQMGFVWNIPHERRYLILLSRLELDDPLAEFASA